MTETETEYEAIERRPRKRSFAALVVGGLLGFIGIVVLGIYLVAGAASPEDRAEASSRVPQAACRMWNDETSGRDLMGHVRAVAAVADESSGRRNPEGYFLIHLDHRRQMIRDLDEAAVAARASVGDPSLDRTGQTLFRDLYRTLSALRDHVREGAVDDAAGQVTRAAGVIPAVDSLCR